MSPKTNRNIVVIAITLVMFIGVVWAVTYARSFQTLIVEVSGDTTTTRISPKDSTTNTKEIEIEYGKPTKLKKGTYTLTTTGEEYETLSTDVELGKTKATLNLEPNYTQQKLQDILRSEQVVIDEAIARDIPKTKAYQLREGRLYKTGQWYGVIAEEAIPKSQIQTTYIDSYKIIMKKEDGQWKTMTPVPEILLTTKAYPTIPREILLDINKYAEPANRPQ
jgi:hypothetical protein